jgi:hypothetical protein
MTTDGAPLVTLPGAWVIRLAELLTQLDEFLRSGPAVAGQLARFLASQGDAHARFSANNLIDDVSFTAAHLRSITHGTGQTTTESAGQPGCHSEGSQPEH